MRNIGKSTNTEAYTILLITVVTGDTGALVGALTMLKLNIIEWLQGKNETRNLFVKRAIDSNSTGLFVNGQPRI